MANFFRSTNFIKSMWCCCIYLTMMIVINNYAQVAVGKSCQAIIIKAKKAVPSSSSSSSSSQIPPQAVSSSVQHLRHQDQSQSNSSSTQSQQKIQRNYKQKKSNSLTLETTRQIKRGEYTISDHCNYKRSKTLDLSKLIKKTLSTQEKKSDSRSKQNQLQEGKGPDHDKDSNLKQGYLSVTKTILIGEDYKQDPNCINISQELKDGTLKKNSTSKKQKSVSDEDKIDAAKSTRKYKTRHKHLFRSSSAQELGVPYSAKLAKNSSITLGQKQSKKNRLKNFTSKSKSVTFADNPQIQEYVFVPVQGQQTRRRSQNLNQQLEASDTCTASCWDSLKRLFRIGRRNSVQNV